MLHLALSYGLAIIKRPLIWLLRPLFQKHGKRFKFDPFGYYTYSSIRVGDDVSLGFRPILLAAKSQIVIGNKVMFGPQVVIIGGGHNTTVVGRFMFDVHEKRPSDDLGVVIEDDVWVGARAVILRGVKVGRGSIVGAGAIVKDDVPPYSVVAGNPAKVVKYRWNMETIQRHEEQLYDPGSRLNASELSTIGRGVN